MTELKEIKVECRTTQAKLSWLAYDYLKFLPKLMIYLNKNNYGDFDYQSFIKFKLSGKYENLKITGKDKKSERRLEIYIIENIIHDYSSKNILQSLTYIQDKEISNEIHKLYENFRKNCKRIDIYTINEDDKLEYCKKYYSKS